MHLISTLLLFNAQAMSTPEMTGCEHKAFNIIEAKHLERHAIE